MSTSNLKSPGVIRQGYVKPWERVSLGGEYGLSFLKWELNKLNITFISYQREGPLLSVFYYRWIQAPFRPKISQRSLVGIKSKVNDTEFLGINLLNFKNKPIKNYRRLALVDRAVRSQQEYQVPYITQVLLAQSLIGINNAVFKGVCFINVFKRVESLYRPINLKVFIDQTPLIKGNVRSVYHILDMVILTDLISLGVCGGELIGKLVGKVLERSSKKGLFVKSLRILSKLPLLIKRFEVRGSLVNKTRSWSWYIKITGKIGGMGRTKVYNVFSAKIPLHTIDNDINYSETIVNTKAGTFSIKVWVLR